jgi:hypothetical protein
MIPEFLKGVPGGFRVVGEHDDPWVTQTGGVGFLLAGGAAAFAPSRQATTYQAARPRHPRDRHALTMEAASQVR